MEERNAKEEESEEGLGRGGERERRGWGGLGPEREDHLKLSRGAGADDTAPREPSGGKTTVELGFGEQFWPCADGCSQ